MRVIVPFTNVSEQTREALDGRAEYIDVSASPESYFYLLKKLWEDAQDFCIVEQDIVVGPNTIEDFERCPEPWCLSPYPYIGQAEYQGLGCMRFRHAFMKVYPDLLEVVGTQEIADHPQKHWCTLDAGVQRELWRRDAPGVCVHNPVYHLHMSPTHACFEIWP